jgi:hypothetical protein
MKKIKDHEWFKQPVLTEIEEDAIIISFLENGPQTEEDIFKVVHYFECEKRKARITDALLKLLVEGTLRIVKFNEDTQDVTFQKVVRQ